VGLLARRDHSRKELETKLVQKGFSSEEIAKTLSYCDDSGYLDDERYAKLVLRSYIAKCQGTLKIQQVLIQKGVDKSIIYSVIEASDCDWFELAYIKCLKKYKDNNPVDAKDRAKRTRYLMGQGFNYEQVSFAFSHNPDE